MQRSFLRVCTRLQTAGGRAEAAPTTTTKNAIKKNESSLPRRSRAYADAHSGERNFRRDRQLACLRRLRAARVQPAGRLHAAIVVFSAGEQQRWTRRRRAFERAISRRRCIRAACEARRSTFCASALGCFLRGSKARARSLRSAP